MFPKSTMTGPDFIVIGAMKSGTSTLAAQLGAQDSIFVTDPKEPNYFSDDDVFAQGEDWYASLFRGADENDLRGEASTHYTKLPTHPKTLARLTTGCQATRFIYLIRNPIDRAVSHFIHEWSQGVIPKDITIDEALDILPEMIAYGQYGMQMEAWLTHFDRYQIHIETLEAMKRGPQDVLRRVGKFLGRDDLNWKADLGQENVSAERLRLGPLDRWLINSAPATWLRQTIVPQTARDWVKSKRRMTNRPAFSANAISKLEHIFAADRELLLRQFPDRSDLDVCYPFCAMSVP